MLSIGAAVLVEIAMCALAVFWAQRRAVSELEPARRSFELLHTSVEQAVVAVSRDTGRAEAGRRLLLRRGKIQAPR
jgi:hypothetical protein